MDMTKFKLCDLIGAGTVSVSQQVTIFMESFSREPVYSGTAADIPDGYKNFIVNGVAAQDNALQVRVTVF